MAKDKRYPTGRAGGYAAPVDTSGMDESMKQTLRIKPSSTYRSQLDDVVKGVRQLGEQGKAAAEKIKSGYRRVKKHLGG